LHPESATSISELLCHHAHAERHWLHHALQAAAGSKKRPLKTTAVKRRLICAAAMALEMHDLTTPQLRNIKVPYNMEALVAVDSHIRVPPGHGLFCPRLYDVIQSYGWPRPAQNVDVHRAVSFKRTELYLELKHCQAELVKAGAANEFDLSGEGMPLAAPDAPSPLPAPSPPPAPAAAPACPTAACPPAASGAACRSARIPTARRTAARFPSPSLALTQSIDDTWQRAARSAHSTGAHPFSALKLQSDLTRSLEATA
jgi:hypothetical protein